MRYNELREPWFCVFFVFFLSDCLSQDIFPVKRAARTQVMWDICGCQILFKSHLCDEYVSCMWMYIFIHKLLIAFGILRGKSPIWQPCQRDKCILITRYERKHWACNSHIIHRPLKNQQRSSLEKMNEITFWSAHWSCGASSRCVTFHTCNCYSKYISPYHIQDQESTELDVTERILFCKYGRCRNRVLEGVWFFFPPS